MADASMTVTGNLTGDPILRFTASGRPVANFSVAVNRGHRDRNAGSWVEDPPLFVRCSLWGDAGENLAASMHKGQRVTVIGEPVPNEWTDKETGAARSSIVLEARDVAASTRFATVNSTRVARDSRATGSTPDPGGDEPPVDEWATSARVDVPADSTATPPF